VLISGKKLSLLLAVLLLPIAYSVPSVHHFVVFFLDIAIAECQNIDGENKAK
jgi:hypothetical protein